MVQKSGYITRWGKGSLATIFTTSFIDIPGGWQDFWTINSITFRLDLRKQENPKQKQRASKKTAVATWISINLKPLKSAIQLPWASKSKSHFGDHCAMFEISWSTFLLKELQHLSIRIWVKSTCISQRKTCDVLSSFSPRSYRISSIYVSDEDKFICCFTVKPMVSHHVEMMNI